MTLLEKAVLLEIVGKARLKSRSKTEALEAFEQGEVDGYIMYEIAVAMQNALIHVAGQLEAFVYESDIC